MPDPLTQLAAEYFCVDARTLALDPIQKGASGRMICRLRAPDGRTVIGIHNDGNRAENADFVRIGHWLREGDVPVAEIVAVEGECCLCSDLGSVDLLHFYQAGGWSASRGAFHDALRGLLRLHQMPTTPPFKLDRYFDEATYRWEQDYFFEHLWKTHLGRSTLPDLAPFHRISSQLGASMPQLVHRDFQSQNLMVNQGRSYFIDFQGMRAGHGEYDLASLLWDPYTGLNASQREELLDGWRKQGGKFDEERFLKCSLQRLMQALGAFANIAHNLGDEWYLQHIQPASASLETILAKLGLASLDL